jgi:hypothetical protein
VLVLVGMIAVAARFIFQPQSIIDIAVCLAITVASWCLLSWFIGLDSEDRKIFLNLAKKVHNKII